MRGWIQAPKLMYHYAQKWELNLDHDKVTYDTARCCKGLLSSPLLSVSHDPCGQVHGRKQSCDAPEPSLNQSLPFSELRSVNLVDVRGNEGGIVSIQALR